MVASIICGDFPKIYSVEHSEDKGPFENNPGVGKAETELE